jgi:hypothetical protein
LGFNEEIYKLKDLYKLYSINLTVPIGFDFDNTDLCELKFITVNYETFSFDMKSMDYHHYSQQNNWIGHIPGSDLLAYFERGAKNRILLQLGLR